MLLSVVRARARAGRAPRRPIRLVFTADEEAGSGLGCPSGWSTTTAELIEGCTEAIGEVGGFSLTVRDDLRLYLIQTAEKGIAWLNLIADGQRRSRLVPQRRQRGHRARRRRGPDRRVRVAAQDHRRAAGVPGRRRGGLGIELDPDRAEESLSRLGSIARMVGATMANTANPTMLQGRLQAQRHPRPGDRGHRRPVRAGRRGRVLRHASPNCWATRCVTRWSPPAAVETEFAGALVEAMQACLVGGGSAAPRRCRTC